MKPIERTYQAFRENPDDSTRDFYSERRVVAEGVKLSGVPQTACAEAFESRRYWHRDKERGPDNEAIAARDSIRRGAAPLTDTPCAQKPSYEPFVIYTDSGSFLAG